MSEIKTKEFMRNWNYKYGYMLIILALRNKSLLENRMNIKITEIRSFL